MRHIVESGGCIRGGNGGCLYINTPDLLANSHSHTLQPVHDYLPYSSQRPYPRISSWEDSVTGAETHRIEALLTPKG